MSAGNETPEQRYWRAWNGFNALGAWILILMLSPLMLLVAFVFLGSLFGFVFGLPELTGGVGLSLLVLAILAKFDKGQPLFRKRKKNPPAALSYAESLKKAEALWKFVPEENEKKRPAKMSRAEKKKIAEFWENPAGKMKI